MRRMLMVILFVLSWLSFDYAQVTAFKDLEIRLGGDVQVDSRNYIDYNAIPAHNIFLRRVRVDLQGTYLKIFQFRLLPNFAPGAVEIEDAYAAINFLTEIKLRGGKFKTPIGLERLQSPTAGFFIEGGLTNNLVPNRDIGIELNGSLASGIINYSLGVYNGTIDGRNDDNDADNSKEFSARVFLLPFNQDKASFFNKLGIGAAFSTENQSGSVLVPRLAAYRTSSLNTFFRFRDSVYASGTRTRIVPQAYLYSSRFGFLGEYVLNTQNIRRNASTLEAATNSWQATVSFMLTDDETSYSGVRPKNNFDLETGGLGAFEVAFRYNTLTVDEELFPIFSNPANNASAAKAWTVALNWYMNSVIRISINYETTTFEAFGSNTPLPDEKLFLTRLQAAF